LLELLERSFINSFCCNRVPNLIELKPGKLTLTAYASSFSRRYSWIVELVIIFCYAICAIAGAAGSDQKAYQFSCIWLMLLAVAYAVGGTLVIRMPKFRSALSVGFLIGVSVMLIQICLMVGVLSGSGMPMFFLGVDPKSSAQAVTAFASLLLISTTFVTVFLILYRDALLPPQQSMASHDQNPVPQAVPAGTYGGTTVVSAQGAYNAGAYNTAAYSDKPFTQPTDVAIGLPTGNPPGVAPTQGGGGVL
jgi:hypothetical protein